MPVAPSETVTDMKAEDGLRAGPSLETPTLQDEDMAISPNTPETQEQFTPPPETTKKKSSKWLWLAAGVGAVVLARKSK